jgi:hypothetical protein
LPEIIRVVPASLGKFVIPTSEKPVMPSDEENMKDLERSTKRKPLTLAEVRSAYEPLGEKYPPLLGLDLAAEISGYTKSTLKKKLSEGFFGDSVARGKPLLFWRDRFVMELMNRPWSSPARSISDDVDVKDAKTEGGDNEVN